MTHTYIYKLIVTIIGISIDCFWHLNFLLLLFGFGIRPLEGTWQSHLSTAYAYYGVRMDHRTESQCQCQQRTRKNVRFYYACGYVCFYHGIITGAMLLLLFNHVWEFTFNNLTCVFQTSTVDFCSVLYNIHFKSLSISENWKKCFVFWKTSFNINLIHTELAKLKNIGPPISFKILGKILT